MAWQGSGPRCQVELRLVARSRGRASCKSPFPAARLPSPLPLQNLLGARMMASAACLPGLAPWAACGPQLPFHAVVLRTWGQRSAPLGRSGRGAFPGKCSPLSEGLLSGIPGSPWGWWTLTATEAATGLSDFYVLGWWDPMATTGQGWSLLPCTQCCLVPGTRGRPTNVC